MTKEIVRVVIAIFLATALDAVYGVRALTWRGLILMLLSYFAMRGIIQ